jgi:hypothetical protein
MVRRGFAEKKQKKWKKQKKRKKKQKKKIRLKQYVSPGSTPGTSIQKLINIDHQKLVEICLKEIIDRFIWTIELCHI